MVVCVCVCSRVLVDDLRTFVHVCVCLCMLCVVTSCCVGVCMFVYYCVCLSLFVYVLHMIAYACL